MELKARAARQALGHVRDGMVLGLGFGAVLGNKQGFGYGRGAAIAGSALAFGAAASLLTLHEYFG